MSGRGKSQKTLDFIEAMRGYLADQHPATVRSVCYQMFVQGWIDSMARKNTQKVSKQLVWAREEGIVPWEWVVDEHRQVEQTPSWDDPESLIHAAASQYRKDYWADQPRQVEVWSEKGTVRGVLKPILDEYGLPFRVMHGFSSATVMNDIASMTRRSNKELVVLYVGDWDPSGMFMSESDIPARLNRYHGEAHINRVALTEEDLGDLPSFEAASKTKDTRHRWFVERYGQKCWELDAMPPAELRGAVEFWVDHYLDRKAWAQSKLIEEAETASIRNLVGSWSESISAQVSKYSGGHYE